MADRHSVARESLPVPGSVNGHAVDVEKAKMAGEEEDDDEEKPMMSVPMTIGLLTVVTVVCILLPLTSSLLLARPLHILGQN